MMRIGNGFDVHAFGDGDHIMLGGVRIAHDRGVVAHSDGDVLIHALCDALLGALALGDIGQHFPPSDDRFWIFSSIVIFFTTMRSFRFASVVSTSANATCGNSGTFTMLGNGLRLHHEMRL